MRIQTFSILAGSEACNARCPFCISKMTPPLGVKLKEPKVNWRNFSKACRLAERSGVTTVMFTGKGEPTLFPGQITKYLEILESYNFPFVEIQTNGIKIMEAPDRYSEHMARWYELGLTTVAVSIVHYDPEKNRQIYSPHKKEYIDLPGLIKTLHDHGFSVRLTCIAANGFIDGPDELSKLIQFAKKNGAEQLTLIPVNKPEDILNREAWDWTNAHHLTDDQMNGIRVFLAERGNRLMTLSHGAVVYDLEGQNVCLNQCLTVQPESEEMRNLIFFPDGSLRYYWQYPGAILLGGNTPAVATVKSLPVLPALGRRE